MSAEVLAIAGIVALGMFVSICFASIVRGARTEAPPPEGRVTSAPVIRPGRHRLGCAAACCCEEVWPGQGHPPDCPSRRAVCTCRPAIRPHGVRPPARPMDWRDRD